MSDVCPGCGEALVFYDETAGKAVSVVRALQRFSFVDAGSQNMFHSKECFVKWHEKTNQKKVV